MKLLYIPFILTLAFTGFSCKKDFRKTRLEIQLNGCNATSINGKTVEVCYDELIEESRCPANANCVWQGVARAKFTINQKNTFELSTLDIEGQYVNKSRQLGYTIRLINIYPYPGLSGNNHYAEIEITY